MITITKNLVSEDKYGIKCPYAMEPVGITVHNTANSASADAEVSYMISNNNEVSYHFAVDENHAVQGLPLNRNAWHCGDGNGKGNRKTIAIEICRSTSEDESLFDRAEENAAELIAALCKEYGWTTDDIYTHQHWTGKYCPHKTLDRGWERFVNMVREKLGEDVGEPDDMPSEDNQGGDDSGTDVNVTYAVQLEDGTILPEVTNLEDYAGIRGRKVVGIAARVDRGELKYQVHVLGGGWLPYVTGCDWNDAANGYAGNGRVIDALRVYYSTPGDIVEADGYKKAKYRVAPAGGNYYSWQCDDETSNGQDGYAGMIGRPIDRVQITIE
ncbi:MAG: N-acetylmuramoyl-L-alanine amidase family protein [Lachnospira sp.]|jgi:hypothetical protein